MKSLEQKLVESEAKLENLSNTKIAINNRSIFVSIPVKPKDKIYIPPFKRNQKEKVYFARLDKSKSSDVLKFLNLLLECIRNQFLFLLVTFVVMLVILDQIVLCWDKNQNLRLDLPLGILMFLNLFLFVTFVVSSITFVPTVINLKLSILCFSLGFVMIYILLQVKINCFISFWKSNLLACERKLQDFGLSQKNCVISQIYFGSHGFSPTKPKMHAIWVRKNLLKNPKTLKNFKKTFLCVCVCVCVSCFLED